jgi:hypothetical protein
MMNCALFPFISSSLLRFLDHTQTHIHTHPVGLIWTSDHLNAKASTYTTHNKYKRQTYMPSVGFEPAIPAIKQQQTYTLDCIASGIGIRIF